LEAAIARLPREYAHVEQLLEPTGWFAGAGPSVADAYFLGLARWGDEFVDQAAYPNIQRLRDRLSRDPAVELALAAEQGRPEQSSGGFEGMVNLADVTRSLQ
jgi:glutathione S-transferase